MTISTILNKLNRNRQLLNAAIFNYMARLNPTNAPSDDYNNLDLVRVKPSSSAISESVRAYKSEKPQVPP